MVFGTSSKVLFFSFSLFSFNDFVIWLTSSLRINAVAPGIILGSGLKNYPEQVQDQLIEDIESGVHTSLSKKKRRRELVRSSHTTLNWLVWNEFNPMGRYGTESEVSAAVVFLLSPGASYITGVTLRVDGASSLCKRMTKLPLLKTNYYFFLLLLRLSSWLWLYVVCDGCVDRNSCNEVISR